MAEDTYTRNRRLIEQQREEIERNQEEIEALKQSQQEEMEKEEYLRQQRRASRRAIQEDPRDFEGRRLDRNGIRRTFTGNSGEMQILATDASMIHYFDSNGRVYSIARGFNSDPQHSADWFVSNDQLCMQSAARGRYCYYLTYTPEGLEGWLSNTRGMEKIFLMKMYEGDAYKIMEPRSLSWGQVAVLAAAALIVGTVLARLAFGTSYSSPSFTGSDRSGEGGGNDEDIQRSTDKREIPPSSNIPSYQDPGAGYSWGAPEYGTVPRDLWKPNENPNEVEY
jgi:hypothetical protein